MCVSLVLFFSLSMEHMCMYAWCCSLSCLGHICVCKLDIVLSLAYGTHVYTSLFLFFFLSKEHIGMLGLVLYLAYGIHMNACFVLYFVTGTHFYAR